MSAGATAAVRVEIRLLGPFEVVVGGRPAPVTGARQQTLLAILALHANEVVSRDRLIEAAWGESPPETVQASLNVAVSKLRRALGGEVLETQAPGYVLRVDDSALDVRRFEQLIKAGEHALAEGEPVRASENLRSALALWRGPPLAEFAYNSFAQAEIARLDDLRLVALEERIEADLNRGRHSVLIGELEALIAQHPWRERLREQLMLALYRAGRQREALEAYKHARRAFVDELGIEPSRELQRLEQAILRQDSALDLPVGEASPAAPAPAAAPAARSKLTRPRLAAVVAVAAGVAVALALSLARGGSGGGRVPANSVAVVDSATNELVASVRVGAAPAAVTTGAGAIWVANVGERTVSRIDPRSRSEVRRIGIGAADVALASGAGSIWALDRERATLLRIDPAVNVAVGRLSLRPHAAPGNPASLAFGGGWLWVELHHGNVLKVSPERARVVDSVPAVGNGRALAVGFGSVWVPSILPNEVRRIDLRSGRALRPIPFERAPTAIATGAGAVWVAALARDQIWRIDPHTNAVTRTIAVGDGPVAIAVGDGAVWVANAFDGTVSRIDPNSNAVVATVEIGGRPSAVAVGGGAVWIAVRGA